MDFRKWKTRIVESIGKYKYVWVVLLVGMVLMMIPGKDSKSEPAEAPAMEKTEIGLSDQLEEILSHIDGVAITNLFTPLKICFFAT